jgi:hypothetical protein
MKIKKFKDRVPGTQPARGRYTNRVVIFEDITGKEWVCNLDDRVAQSNYIENNLTPGACFAGFRKQSDTHLRLKSPIKCIYNPQLKLL